MRLSVDGVAQTLHPYGPGRIGTARLEAAQMSYSLKARESVTRGLRRLARKELSSASENLRQSDAPQKEAIHEARKSLKKVRAIVGVIEADGGHGLNGSSKRLRTINRTLSDLRDADAMLSALETLRKTSPRLLRRRPYGRVYRHLASRRRTLMKTASRDGTWRSVAQDLEKVRRDAKQWRPAHRRFRALESAVRLTHRLGRKAMARARKRQQPADFHEWRKQMKALWYELRLVEGAGGRVRKDINLLHRAGTWLGEEHNAVVLCEELGRDTSICESVVDLDRIRLAADQYQCSLREKTMRRARAIYGRKSSDYVRGIRRAWESWLRHATATSRRGARAAA
jgi:CHAD domain-containing protein